MKVETPLLRHTLSLILACHCLLVAEIQAAARQCVKSVELKDHLIRADKTGKARQPVSSTNDSKSISYDKFTNSYHFERYVSNMLHHAEQFAETNRQEKFKGKTVVRLLIHAHGGLTQKNKTNKRVWKLSPQMMNEPEHWHYPIYISWNSTFFNTYMDHLSNIRQGVRDKTIPSKSVSPLLFSTDLTRTAAKAPMNYYYQIMNFKDRSMSGVSKFPMLQIPEAFKSHLWKLADTNYQIYAKTYRIRRGTYFHRVRASTKRWTFGLVKLPFRVTLGTLGQSSLARSSWRNMLRRTDNMFFPDSLSKQETSSVQEALKEGRKKLWGNSGSASSREDVGNHNGASSAAGRFFALLNERVAKRKKQYEYRVTLVGHSMGAIVINNALRKYRRQWIENHCIENIVYMAAAASIGNTVDSVLPIVQGQDFDSSRILAQLDAIMNEQNLPEKIESDFKSLKSRLRESSNDSADSPIKTHFYNLTLNPVAEISESAAWGFAPYGSLLEWIDQHLEDPGTILNRTMGSEINVLAGFPALTELAPYSDFKSFDSDPAHIPGEHGDFNDCPFWLPSFWSHSTIQGTHKDKPLNWYSKPKKTVK